MAWRLLPNTSENTPWPVMFQTSRNSVLQQTSARTEARNLRILRKQRKVSQARNTSKEKKRNEKKSYAFDLLQYLRLSLCKRLMLLATLSVDNDQRLNPVVSFAPLALAYLVINFVRLCACVSTMGAKKSVFTAVLFTLASVLSAVSEAEAKVVERCELAQLLRRCPVDASKKDFLKVTATAAAAAASFKNHTQTSISHLKPYLKNTNDTQPFRKSKPSQPGRIYSRCELARELYYRHKLPLEQIPIWVCIAQHESQLDTAAVGHLNADGSADHGLFQISDQYWCSRDSHVVKGCGLHCSKLLDDDIADDVRCIRRIYREHLGISGDGFTAWAVYDRDCRDQRYEDVATCFAELALEQHDHHQNSTPFSYLNNEINTPAFSSQSRTGKVYDRCELARELRVVHKFPIEHVGTWVCIAQHESNYDTAAVGRLNGDGSADHGLFQISDRYWCSNENSLATADGAACNIACSKLVDSDITDDVACIRTIYAEHAQISGDGFNAWTVYKDHCRHQGRESITDCWEGMHWHERNSDSLPGIDYNFTTAGAGATPYGKRYTRCELAQELYFEHKMAMSDIPTWVCIAQHESNFDTAAVGRLNADGSTDHGLFQISDLYWCSHSAAGGKGCGIACSKLLDSNIYDDVRCVRTIYDEHTRLSGDGFTAWTVYRTHCRRRQIEGITDCFDNKLVVKEARKAAGTNQEKQHRFFEAADSSKSSASSETNLEAYPANPFLSQIRAPGISREANPSKKRLDDESSQHRHESTFLSKSFETGFKELPASNNLNPFLSRFIAATNPLPKQHRHKPLVVKPQRIEEPTSQTESSFRPVQTTKKYIESESFRTKPMMATKPSIQHPTIQPSTQTTSNSWFNRKTTKTQTTTAATTLKYVQKPTAATTKTTPLPSTNLAAATKRSTSSKSLLTTRKHTTTTKRPTAVKTTPTRALTKTLRSTTKTTRMPTTKNWRTTIANTKKPATKAATSTSWKNWWETERPKKVSSPQARPPPPTKTTPTTTTTTTPTTATTRRTTSTRHTTTTTSPITPTLRRPTTTTTRKPSNPRSSALTRKTSTPTPTPTPTPTAKAQVPTTASTLFKKQQLSTSATTTTTTRTTTTKRPTSMTTKKSTRTTTTTTTTTKLPTKITTPSRRSKALGSMAATAATATATTTTTTPRTTTQKSKWRWAVIPTSIPTTTTTTTETTKTATILGKTSITITRSQQKPTRSSFKSTRTTTVKQTENKNNNNKQKQQQQQQQMSSLNKSDPFSHPFFAKFNEEFELLKAKAKLKHQ